MPKLPPPTIQLPPGSPEWDLYQRARNVAHDMGRWADLMEPVGWSDDDSDMDFINDLDFIRSRLEHTSLFDRRMTEDMVMRAIGQLALLINRAEEPEHDDFRAKLTEWLDRLHCSLEAVCDDAIQHHIREFQATMQKLDETLDAAKKTLEG